MSADLGTAAGTGVEPVPARADGVELLGEVPGSGYRRPPALARRGDGQTIQLTPLLYALLSAVDGERDHDQLAARTGAATGRLVGADDVRLLLDKLRPLGLLRLPDGSQPQVRKSDPLLGLRFRYVVTDPAVTRRITTPFARLFHPLVVLAFTAAFVAVAGWVLMEKGLASATYQAFDRPGLMLAVVAITVVSAGFHEFGHAAAARYGGATPGAMGAALYLVWPAFYTDVTDSYRLGRAGRVRTDLGGLYFNAIVAVAMYGVWWLTGWDALLLVIATQVLQMVRQLTPLVRFDGYHVLADLTGVPDLYHRIGPTLLGLLPHRWGSAESNAESRVLKPWARAVVAVWVIVVVPLLLLSLVVMVVALPRLIATGWASLGRQWTMLDAGLADGDVAGVLVRVLAMVAIALPLLGMVYLLVRLARQLARGVWRWTDGRPARRGLAVLAAAAVALGLAWAWWPDGETYRPIQPYERGTLADVAPAVLRTPLQPRGAAAGVGIEEGGRGTARTVWSGAERPTPERPALAIVLVPATGSDAPTWVFPFDHPPAPDKGDNQALAINTTDGSTVYDVAFALVWVTDGEVTNDNEAYALASCRDCTTVAVGFQVILVVGQADVVVPENVAVAVNYACVECLTHAIAAQLVVTLPGALSDGAMAELSALWSQIEEFGRNLQGLPLDQVYAQLEEFKAKILEIVLDEAQPGDVQPTGTTSAPPGSSQPPGTDPATTGSTGPTAEPGGTSRPSTQPSTQPPGESSGQPSSTAEPSEPSGPTEPPEPPEPTGSTQPPSTAPTSP